MRDPAEGDPVDGERSGRTGIRSTVTNPADGETNLAGRERNPAVRERNPAGQQEREKRTDEPWNSEIVREGDG